MRISLVYKLGASSHQSVSCAPMSSPQLCLVLLLLLLSCSTLVLAAGPAWGQEFWFSNLKHYLASGPLSNETCYDGWGCFPKFEISRELSAPLSAVAMYADPPEDIDVHFLMHDCRRHRFKGQSVRYNASEQSLRNITYEGNKQTILIIHGSNDQYNEMAWSGVSLNG